MAKRYLLRIVLAGAMMCICMLLSCGKHDSDDVYLVYRGEMDKGQYLSSLHTMWSEFSGNSITAVNRRRGLNDIIKTLVFNNALMLYKQMHGDLPDDKSAEELVEIFEDEGLIPFLPVDPETGREVRFVGSRDEIKNWEDVLIELGDDEEFHYWMMVYSKFRGDDYAPSLENTGSISDLNILLDLNLSSREEGYIQPDTNEEITAELFSDLIRLEFIRLIDIQFYFSGGNVPDSLEALLQNKLKINPDGWGSPCGALSPDRVGNFEYGVDPSINAYYMEYTTGNGIQFEARRFIKTKIGNELVYDLLNPTEVVMSLGEEDLKQRVTLLTDELFASGL